MNCIEIKTLDNENYIINLENLAWCRPVNVGGSYQVTFKTIDGQKLLAIMNSMELSKLKKLLSLNGSWYSFE